MKRLSILIAIILFSTFNIYAGELLSPDKNIKIVLTADIKKNGENNGKVFFKIQYKEKDGYVDVLPNSALGIVRKDEQFEVLTLTGESKEIKIHDKYTMITGKRKLCENYGTEKTFSFKNSNNQPLNIVFRAYNNGVTFRYNFPNQSDTVNITDETTSYTLPDSTNRWMQPFHSAYEDFFPLSKTGQSSKPEQEWGYPALFKVNNLPLWVLMTEANISENNCSARLNNKNSLNTYKVTYAPPRGNFNQTGVLTTLPWNSQWHVLIIGKLKNIVESTLVTDVSNPNQVTETSWIKPGPAAWIYWYYNHGSKDFQLIKEYIDLAAAMSWPYVLIDWEWDVMTNGGNIEDAVKYAGSKGINVLMWYNSGTEWLDASPADRLLTHEKREKEFAWLNKIGAKGIKVDFFAGDQQDMMKYYIDILKDASDFKLLVNFHGATIPRGWARTYPNLLSVEAVYGAEWYNNAPALTDKAASHNTTLPFTRNVVGSMDYTPVGFSNTQHPHITTYAHELALSVVFESGLQHLADKPSAYYSLPAEPKEFLKNLPTAWDDTKLIDGYPGEKVIIARKKGDKWYIGGLNGKDEKQVLQFNTDFAGNKDLTIQIIKDGNDDKSFSSELIKVKKGEAIKIECLPRGGFCWNYKNRQVI